MNNRDVGPEKLDPQAIAILRELCEMGYTPEQVVAGLKHLKRIKDEAHERESK